MPNYATSTEWDSLKETIIELYWVQNLPLRKVAGFMEEEHGFRATPKMYKVKFKAWGLNKNLKQSDIRRLWTGASQNMHPEPIVVQGRELGSARLRQRLRENLSSERAQILLFEKSVHHIRSPDDSMAAEMSIHSVLDYTNNRIETGAWMLGAPYMFNRDCTALWWMRIDLAVDLLSRRRDWPEAFRLLRDGFKGLEAILDQQEPCLVIAICIAVIGLGTIGHELSTSLLTYAARLSAIKLGLRHPLSVFLSQTNRLESDQTSQLAGAVTDAQMRAIASSTGPNHGFRELATLYSLRPLVRSGVLPLEIAEAEFVRITSWMDSITEHVGSDMWVKWLEMMWIHLCVEDGRYAHAMVILERAEGGLPAQQATDPMDPMASHDLTHRAKTHVGIGQPYENSYSFDGLLDLFETPSRWSFVRQLLV